MASNRYGGGGGGAWKHKNNNRRIKTGLLLLRAPEKAAKLHQYLLNQIGEVDMTTSLGDLKQAFDDHLLEKTSIQGRKLSVWWKELLDSDNNRSSSFSGNVQRSGDVYSEASGGLQLDYENFGGGQDGMEAADGANPTIHGLVFQNSTRQRGALSFATRGWQCDLGAQFSSQRGYDPQSSWNQWRNNLPQAGTFPHDSLEHYGSLPHVSQHNSGYQVTETEGHGGQAAHSGALGPRFGAFNADGRPGFGPVPHSPGGVRGLARHYGGESHGSHGGAEFSRMSGGSWRGEGARETMDIKGPVEWIQPSSVGHFFINRVLTSTTGAEIYSPPQWTETDGAEILTFDDLIFPVTELKRVVLSSTAGLEQSIKDGFFERFSQATRIQACVNKNAEFNDGWYWVTVCKTCPQLVVEGQNADMCPDCRQVELVAFSELQLFSRFMILRFTDLLRVIVPSASLSMVEWNKATQFGWYNDFPIRFKAEQADRPLLSQESEIIHCDDAKAAQTTEGLEATECGQAKEAENMTSSALSSSVGQVKADVFNQIQQSNEKKEDLNGDTRGGDSQGKTEESQGDDLKGRVRDEVERCESETKDRVESVVNGVLEGDTENVVEGGMASVMDAVIEGRVEGVVDVVSKGDVENVVDIVVEGESMVKDTDKADVKRVMEDTDKADVKSVVDDAVEGSVKTKVEGAVGGSGKSGAECAGDYGMENRVEGFESDLRCFLSAYCVNVDELLRDVDFSELSPAVHLVWTERQRCVDEQDVRFGMQRFDVLKRAVPWMSHHKKRIGVFRTTHIGNNDPGRIGERMFGQFGGRGPGYKVVYPSNDRMMKYLQRSDDISSCTTQPQVLNAVPCASLTEASVTVIQASDEVSPPSLYSALKKDSEDPHQTEHPIVLPDLASNVKDAAYLAVQSNLEATPEHGVRDGIVLPSPADDHPSPPLSDEQPCDCIAADSVKQPIAAEVSHLHADTAEVSQPDAAEVPQTDAAEVSQPQRQLDSRGSVSEVELLAGLFQSPRPKHIGRRVSDLSVFLYDGPEGESVPQHYNVMCEMEQLAPVCGAEGATEGEGKIRRNSAEDAQDGEGKVWRNGWLLLGSQYFGTGAWGTRVSKAANKYEYFQYHLGVGFFPYTEQGSNGELVTHALDPTSLGLPFDPDGLVRYGRAALPYMEWTGEGGEAYAHCLGYLASVKRDQTVGFINQYGSLHPLYGVFDPFPFSTTIPFRQAVVYAGQLPAARGGSAWARGGNAWARGGAGAWPHQSSVVEFICFNEEPPRGDHRAALHVAKVLSVFSFEEAKAHFLPPPEVVRRRSSDQSAFSSTDETVPGPSMVAADGSMGARQSGDFSVSCPVHGRREVVGDGQGKEGGAIAVSQRKEGGASGCDQMRESDATAARYMKEGGATAASQEKVGGVSRHDRLPLSDTSCYQISAEDRNFLDTATPEEIERRMEEMVEESFVRAQAKAVPTRAQLDSMLDGSLSMTADKVFIAAMVHKRFEGRRPPSPTGPYAPLHLERTLRAGYATFNPNFVAMEEFVEKQREINAEWEREKNPKEREREREMEREKEGENSAKERENGTKVADGK